MDRGERRRRDENYVLRNKRLVKERSWEYRERNRVYSYPTWPKGRTPWWYMWVVERNLGAKKHRPLTCGCTKKTFGRPKVARGGCKAYPWIPRSRWRRRLEQDED